MNFIFQKLISPLFHWLRLLVISLCLMGYSSIVSAQCPPNIDFERGDFSGWECWVGHTFNNGGVNAITWDLPGLPVPPQPNRHTMLSSFPGDGIDFFGQFPKNCPNGSGHSIMLGNTTGGHEAEGVSYTFTIPAGQNEFNLIYHYAVVFQGPVHADPEQPRLVIEVKNLTDNNTITCSSFQFFYSTSSSTIPGFYLSSTNNTGTPVWCKNWSAASIRLDGMAGKTIQIFFKTADCTFNAHFGYAYVDVNTECSSSFTGATFCPDDTAINVTAPYGYQNYNWWNSNFTVLLGNTQVLHLSPPPLSGSIVKVELVPYSGYGCLDTLTAHLLDTLTIQPHAGADTFMCVPNQPVQLGAPPLLGLVYKWSPVTGLSNPDIANPIATVGTSTLYELLVTHDGGGCLTKDTVNVNIINYDTTLQVIGPISKCSASSQLIALKVQPGPDSIQWYRNNIAIPGANQVQLNVTQSGVYHAALISFHTCTFMTRDQQIDIYQSPVAGFSHNDTSQCFTGHQFVFTNTSSPPDGTPVYRWEMGDGTILNTADVTYSYLQTGTYPVKMVISGNGGCADSAGITVHVFPSPKAGFKINNAAQCFKNNLFVFTDTSTVTSGNITYYYWNLGDGNLPGTNNVMHNYLLPGNYTVTLRTDAPGGCTDQVSHDITVYESPSVTFTVNTPNQCFTANRFVFTNNSTPLNANYIWNMGDGTTLTTKDVTYSYAAANPYTVKLTVTTTDGCTDSLSADLNVWPIPVADFLVQPVCTNVRVPLINKTINNTSYPMNYIWDLGDGQTSNLRTPVYSYPRPGTYTIKLTVGTTQCFSAANIKEKDIVVDAPLPGISYPVKEAVMNFPEPLQARQLGNSILWIPRTSLDNRTSYNPVFNGRDPQLYTIELKTTTGCLTVDTQYVKTRKKIEIYVPTAFSPNGNGINERLRPFLMGFDHVNYFRVFDRWGKLLYEMRSDKPGWDGKTNDQLQEIQTVVWMIEAVDIDGVVHRRQGTTIVLH